MSDSINTAIDVAYETEISIAAKSTEQLTAEANVQYRQAESLAAMSLVTLADVGRKISEIKTRIPHGEFEDWCAANLIFSKRQAEQYMKLASKMDDENSLFSKTQTFADIGISRVWALLAAPEEVASELMETNNVADMTVRELKEEIRRLKAEKEAAEDRQHEAELTIFSPESEELADLREAVGHLHEELKRAEHEKEMAENSNDSIRKELASVQRKLSDSVSEEELARMQEEYEEHSKALNAELSQVKSSHAEIQAKLDKAKEDLKKQKAKQKELEAAKDEEIRKRLEEASTELTNKAKEEAFAESEAEIRKNLESITALEEQVKKLEADKAKLSNTGLMEFKVYYDQLQDIYWKICELITLQNEEDPEIGAKMQGALQKLIGGWKP